MKKDISEILKDIPTWIDSVPTAKAYKNAVIAGNGDKLFRTIKMVGNQDAYETCLKDFVHFLFTMNLIDSENISMTSSDSVHSNVEQVVNKPGTYWFFDSEHTPIPGTKVVTFNISNVKLEKKLLVKIIENLGLTVDYDTLSLLLENYIGWENVISEEDFINNTILAHYGSYEDDILKPSDLEWINDSLIGNISDNMANTVEKKEVESDRTNQNNHIDSTNTINDIPAPDNESDTKKAPIIVEETEESAKAKIAFNKQLNAKMYELYEQTAARLKAERDVRWKDFISQYKKAIEDENYNVRSCQNYLVMTSRDIKSPIYKVLYDADQATKQYQTDLQRIKRTTLCFACREYFDADITFAKYKEHTVKCPKCGNLVRMTIDWLK